MKWIMILSLVIYAPSVMADSETPFVCVNEEETTGIAGRRPGYDTRDATVLSMMGWGIVIAVAIATFTGLVKNHTAPTTTSSSSTTQ